MDGKELTKRFEGFSDKVYLDSLGNPTVGWGCHLFVGRKIPTEILLRLFDGDYRIATQGYDALHLDLDPVRRIAVIDLIFNMGLAKFMKFKRTLDSIRSGDYESAANHLADSRWYRQVGNRGREIVSMMRTGTPPTAHHIKQ